MITAIPSFFQFVKVEINLGFARIFRLLRLIRILRVFKVFQSKERNEDGQEKSNDEGEFRKKMLSSLFTILCIVFLSTGIVHFLDRNFPEYFKITMASQTKIMCQRDYRNGTIINYNVLNTTYDIKSSFNIIGMHCNDTNDQIVKIEGGKFILTYRYYLRHCILLYGYYNCNFRLWRRCPNYINCKSMYGFICINKFNGNIFTNTRSE